MPLNDTQQAELTILSMSLIAIGTVSIPLGAPWYAGLAMALAGAVGQAVKEYLGSAPKPNQ